MRWVAPTEKDTANETLEKRLWATANQFRAHSGLKASQCSALVLGLNAVFCRGPARRLMRHDAGSPSAATQS